MPFHDYIQRVMSGAERGAVAAVARGALAAASPVYAGIVRLRNRGYDANPGKVHRLPRPVVSVGNITTGGTGKTPVVRWLAERLRDGGHRVAVLSRGYKAAAAGELGDEQRMLERLLNGRRAADAAPPPPVLIRAHPDRVASAEAVLREHPEVGVFLLDDGFQHRRLGRDLDVVLVNAAEPFGYGHVLPRGLLREPLDGLRRAGAVILTHADAVSADRSEEIAAEVRRHSPGVPVYHCTHAATAVRVTNEVGVDESLPTEWLAGRPVFAFCGLGNPAGFERTLAALGARVAGRRWFPDHYGYSPGDVAALRAAARAAGAEVLVTAEKDWVKVATLPDAVDAGLPIARVDVTARFRQGDGDRLLVQVTDVILAHESAERGRAGVG